MAKTIADKVAALFGDGTTFQKNGTSLEEAACEQYGASVHFGRTDWIEDDDMIITGAMTREVCPSEHRSDDPIRYVFSDGSAIVVVGAIWDIEGTMPFHCRGE
jgi:hypothetical protein